MFKSLYNYLIAGNELYSIVDKIGEGAFAKIYSANILDDDDFELESNGKEVAIKVESPACPWELYISKQLNVRTKNVAGVDVVSRWDEFTLVKFVIAWI